MPTPDGELRILHPTGAQLQALAHPLRSRLLGALRFHGPATSTALAARLGTNSGATSYHLRQLAEAGLVEDDPERSNGRDRWWRSVHDATSWRSTDYDDDPDARAGRRLARPPPGPRDGRLAQRLARRPRDEWSPEWRDAADQSDYHLDLTAHGLRALMDDLRAVADRYRDAPAEAGRRAGDAPPAGVPQPRACGVSAADLRSLRRRFHLLLVLRFIPTGLFITVFVLLMLDRGLSLAQIGLGTAAQGIVMLFLELPSGGLADALGRKPVLILASLFVDRGHEPAARRRHGAAARRRVGAAGRVPRPRQRSARVVVHRRVARRRSRRRHRGRPGPAERRHLHVDRRRRHGSAAPSPPPTACSGIDPLVVPIVLGLLVQVVGLVAVIALHARGRASGEGWAAARRSIAAVPAVVGGAVRLIRASSLLTALVVAELLWGFGMIAFEMFFPPRLAQVSGGVEDAARLLGPAITAAWVLSGVGRGVRAVARPAVRVGRWPACTLRVVHGRHGRRHGAGGRAGRAHRRLPRQLLGPRRHRAGALRHGPPRRREQPPGHGRVGQLAHVPGRRRRRAASRSAPSPTPPASRTAMFVAGVVLAAAAPLYLVGRSAGTIDAVPSPTHDPVA